MHLGATPKASNIDSYSIRLTTYCSILPLLLFPLWVTGLHCLTIILKSWLLYEVIVFSWQLLLDKALIYHNLCRQEVFLDPDGTSLVCLSCSWWILHHLFITCKFPIHVCYKIWTWLEWKWAMTHDLLYLWSDFRPLRVESRCMNSLVVVRHSVGWSNWKWCSDINFFFSSWKILSN